MTRLDTLKDTIRRHQLTMAIGLTVVIAIIMTTISLSLYASSGTLQLDLSRPGYEIARKEIINPKAKADFAPNGPINSQALDQFQKLYDDQRSELNAFGKYKDDSLEDESLSLAVEAPQN